MELRKMVKEILIKYPKTRDDNPQLTCKVWRWQAMELGREDLRNVSFTWFEQQYCKGNMSQGDSITRQSRLLQETHPELRGERREKKEFQEEVKNMVATYKAERIRP